MAVTRGTLQIMRQLRRDIGSEVDAAVRTLTGEWVSAWDALAPVWQAAADQLVTAAVAFGRWPRPVELMRMGSVDTAMRGSIAALDKLAERTEAVTVDGAERVIQIDVEREPRIIASQAPATEEPALRQRVQALTTEALRENAQTDVRLAATARIRTDAVNVISTRAAGQIHARTLPLAPAAVDAMRRELVHGIDVGSNPTVAAARIVDSVQGQFNGGLTRALTIARTEMLDAYRATSQQIHAANQDIVAGWQWLAAFDLRVCPSCISMHGTTHPVAEPGPIDHQQGRCTRLPVLASWAQLGISAPEPPSVVPNAQEWFSKLPKASQLQIMGPGRLHLLDSGLIGWGDLSTVRQTPGWRPSRIPASLRNLRQRAERGLSPTSVAQASPVPATAAPPRPPFSERIAAARKSIDSLDDVPLGLSPRQSARLTPDERDALTAYSLDDYKPINGALRSGTVPPRVQTLISRMDSAISRSPLPDDYLVYRGVTNGGAVFGRAWEGNLVGAEWTEAGYLSTATNRTMAEGFAGIDPRAAVMRILAPRGTNGVMLSRRESELLLQRNLRLRVVADTPASPDDFEPRFIDVEIVQ